jgi:RNA polymerase sigma factor (sigma-70 family)
MSSDALNKRAAPEPGECPERKQRAVMLEGIGEAPTESKHQRQQRLAVRWQEPHCLAELMASLDPILQQLVRRFPMRGTLEVDDLLQAARIGALKAIRIYDPNRGEVATCVHQRAYQEITELIHTQGQDVHRSEADRKSRARLRRPPTQGVSVESRDHEPEANAHAGEIEELNPEALFSSAEQVARLREVIRELPREQRDLVRDHFGIGGREARSVRELHNDMGISRTKATKLLEEALAFIAKRMKKATR